MIAGVPDFSPSSNLPTCRYCNAPRTSINQSFPARGNIMDNPGENETQAPQLVASATLLWVLAASLVGLRSYIRTKIVKVFGAEDWTLLTALVFSLAHSICLVIRQFSLSHTHALSLLKTRSSPP